MIGITCSTMDESTHLLTAHSLTRRQTSVSVCSLAYLSYLVCGSLLFIYLEQETEGKVKEKIQRRKEEYLNDNPEVTEEDLERLLEDIINVGTSPLKKDYDFPSWSFGQSFLFSVTIVNTIGYGHVSPLTQPGIVFCIIFALLGIPASFIFISTRAETLLQPTIAILQYITQGLQHSKGICQVYNKNRKFVFRNKLLFC